MISTLIIEDDPMVVEINRRYLEMIPNFTCIDVASNASDALTKLQALNIDLVLLDLFMPGRNGLQLLAEIRARAQAVDVIVISAASDIQSINTALRLGVVDYLIKPFQFERFSAALKKYQEEHNLLDNQGSLSQHELDQLIFYRNHNKIVKVLPKGLTRTTLKLIIEQIGEWRDEPFSTEDLADKTGVSRVSIRKYLNFLESIGYLSVHLNYRAVGRPICTYQVNSNQQMVVQPFIMDGTD